MPEEGFCYCGCGQKTMLAKKTSTRNGHIQGQPVRFIYGHHRRGIRNFGSDNYHWKGGSYKNNDGYVWIKSPDHPRANRGGYVAEHILIAEKALGKILPINAVIHHANGTKDSGPLVICQDNAYHQLLHRRMRALIACGHADWRKCRYCKEYGDPETIYMPPNKAYGTHRRCEAIYKRTGKNPKGDNMFALGDKVEWESHGDGFTIKVGNVVAIVPPGIHPTKTEFGIKHRGKPYESYFPNHRMMFDGIGPRDHESYLIEVPGGKTAKATPKLYWPRVSQLRKVEG